MFLTVNHNEAGNNEYELIAEGKYQAIIKEAEVTKSSSGNDMIKVTVVIRDDVKQPFGKRKVWDYIVASDKAKWKIQQVAKAIELPQGKAFNTIQEFAKEILFKPVTIDVKHEESTYNGETKTKERIAFYDVASVGVTTPSSADPFSAPTTTQSPF
jgi:hypothetical protein